MTTTRPRLVALRALHLGDLLTAVPALRALAAAHLEHHKVLVLPRPVHALATALGVADEVRHAAPLGPLDADLAGAAVAVNLHGRGPESHARLAELRPGRLLAFRHPACPASHDGPRWRREEHEVRRWCRLLRHYGIPADPADLDIEPPDREPPAPAVGATVIHPGAASGARRWPPERFAAVARHERLAGRPVVVTGGPGEVPLATGVAERAGLGTGAVLAGATDLLELVAVVSAAARVVCGDTGVAHLATALRTPSVVLFGPTPPSRWGPPADRRWHRALWAGRRGDPHGDAPDAGLLELGVDHVVAQLADLDRVETDGLTPTAARVPAPRAVAPAGARGAPTVCP